MIEGFYFRSFVVVEEGTFWLFNVAFEYKLINVLMYDYVV